MAQNMMQNLQAIAQNTAADSIKMLDIDELHESPDNFFTVDRIEELADTILGQGGVKDNLIVCPQRSGGYEIISGHRRRAAVKLLLDRGERISRYLPCLVQNYWDNGEKQIDIVLMNISSRQITDAELWQSYKVLDRILKEKKSSGMRFGRIREKLAELLGISTGQVSKLENVRHNAVPSVVEAVQNGELSLSAANEIAKMDAVSQLTTKKEGKKPKKRATNGTNSDPRKCATNGTKSEAFEQISHFITEHYGDLESIFTAYSGLSDNAAEQDLLHELLTLLHTLISERVNDV